MTRKQQIEADIEAAMNSIDGLRPASPPPFLYTRVTARLTKEEKNIWWRMSRVLSRPVIAAAGVMLVIGINIFAVLHQHPVRSSYRNAPEQAEVAVADEYNYATVYNIDNEQQQ